MVESTKPLLPLKVWKAHLDAAGLQKLLQPLVAEGIT